MTQTNNQQWLDQLLALGNPWAERYKAALGARDSEKIDQLKKIFRDFDAPAEVLSFVHNYLAAYGYLTDLRQSAEEVKREYWEEAKLWAPRASVPKTSRIARSIYVMAFLIEYSIIQKTTTE